MIFSAITGFIGAYYWLRSARVPITPIGDFEPLDEADKATFWNASLMDAFQKSSALNRNAAMWTGVAVILAGAGEILQVWA